MQNSQYLIAKHYNPTITFLGSLFSPLIFALPENPCLIADDVSIAEPQKQMDIEKQTNKAILNWSDIYAHEAVSIVQPSSTVTLNRVIGNSPSDIYGKLFENGKFFLVNSNEATFGANAQMNTGALFVSTLDIDNKELDKL